jgi:hypothetical protein
VLNFDDLWFESFRHTDWVSWLSRDHQTNAGICLKILSLRFFLSSIYYYLIIIYTFYSLSYWIYSLHKLLINKRKFHMSSYRIYQFSTYGDISRCRHVKLHCNNALCWYKLDTFQFSVTELCSSWITPIVYGRKLKYIKMARHWSASSSSSSAFQVVVLSLTRSFVREPIVSSLLLLGFLFPSICTPFEIWKAAFIPL